MPARSKARKRALDVLFEAEVRGEPVLDLLNERVADADPPVAPYAVHLVQSVQAHRGRIDELLAAYAEDWTLPRMAAVDRNILRIGAFELLWADDIPDGVAISEAVALASDLSSDAAPAFVNGLLAKLLAVKPTLADALADETEPLSGAAEPLPGEIEEHSGEPEERPGAAEALSGETVLSGETETSGPGAPR